MGRVKAFDAAGTAKAAPTATTVLFTGRVFDAETGLYYFRARYFEPELGVFISRDPLGFVDGYAVHQGWFMNKLFCDPHGNSTIKANDYSIEIRTVSLTVGPRCGFFDWRTIFVLNKPAEGSEFDHVGMFIQEVKIDGRITYCDKKTSKIIQEHYWEGWRVDGGRLVEEGSSLKEKDSYTDKYAYEADDEENCSRGEISISGKLSYYHGATDYPTNFTSPEDGSPSQSVWGSSSPPIFLADDTVTISQSVNHSIKVSWDCCDKCCHDDYSSGYPHATTVIERDPK